MNIDFPLILVLATFITGAIWLADAMFFAQKRKHGSSGMHLGSGRAAGKEPLIVEYARSFFPVILAVLVLRSAVVEPFRIPSGSMMPTLLIGDFILVNKFSYGIRLPVLNKKIVDLGEPATGDVVVFRYPKEPSIDYIKRVVAVPGDTVDYRNKTIFINGKAASQVQMGLYNGTGSGERMTGTLENIEALGGVEHAILVNQLYPDLPPGCQMLASGTITVPEGYYFVMGDNRDNSNDSRCWGYVPEKNLVGKAFAIWMSWDSQQDSFLPISWERIGEGID
ncbi:MAG: signal peptidase I [Gammaproteobacteria bacterium]|nr:signal peptidase I [Gammaproteobacteria bacterium]